MDKRQLSKKYFLESGIDNTPYNWHIWKRAFDLGMAEEARKQEALPILDVSPCLFPDQKDIDDAYEIVITEDMTMNLDYGSKDFFIRGIHFCVNWLNKG